MVVDPPVDVDDIADCAVPGGDAMLDNAEPMEKELGPDVGVTAVGDRGLA